MSIFEFVPNPWGTLAFIAVSLIPLVKVAINSYNMTAIEKIRLTNNEKFVVFVSQLVVMSAIMGTLLLLLFLSESMNNNEEASVSLNVLAATAYLISSLFILFILSVVYGLFTMCSVKTSFYIDESEPLLIVKKIDKHTYLLRGKVDNHLFYDEKSLVHIHLYEEMQHIPKGKWLIDWVYSYKMYGIGVVGLLFLVGVILSTLKVNGIGAIFLLLSMGIMLFIGISVKNYEDIERLSRSKESRNKVKPGQRD